VPAVVDPVRAVAGAGGGLVAPTGTAAAGAGVLDEPVHPAVTLIESTAR